MSDRFSEIKNAKWCKLCSANIIEGQPHPDEDAHLAEQLKRAEAAKFEANLTERLSATSSLIPVSSNDMLRHIAQPGSPETLCGRLITDRYRPSTTDLVCDVCADLSQSSSFIVEGDEPESSGFDVTAMNYTRDGYKIDDDGFTVLTSEEETKDYGFTFDKFVTASESDYDLLDYSDDEVFLYAGSELDEPIQFTAHWLEEDNEEEPLFLPNNDL